MPTMGAVIGAFLWFGVISDPAVLKLLGAMAVILIIGLAWAAATRSGEKKEVPDA